MALKTYDPDLVIVTFRPYATIPALAALQIGTITAEAFAEGSMVTVNRSAKLWSSTSGTDGETVHSKSPDKSGVVALTLMGSSVTNDLFSALVIADELTNIGVGVLTVADKSGSSIFASAQARLDGYADYAAGSDPGTREWSFLVANLAPFIGGNTLDASS